MKRSVFAFAAAVSGLGLCTLVFQDFLLQWQAVPAGLPGREVLALVSGAILLVGGVALVFERTVVPAAVALALYFAAWTLFLQVPKVLDEPAGVVGWLGVAEITVMACASAMIAGSRRSDPPRSSILSASQILFGLSAVIFGVSHFAYLEFTASMVPAWMPASTFWAGLTGVGHCAAGLALISGFQARAGALGLSIMCLVFAVLLHAPRVFAAPTSQMEWTMLAIALAISASAWIASRVAIDRPLALVPPQGSQIG